MKVQRLTVGDIGTNCYIAANEETGEALVIDPGGDGAYIADTLKDKGLKCAGILYTHGHCDHTDGTEDLVDRCDDKPEVCALDKEEPLLLDPRLNLAPGLGYGNRTYPADRFFTDGQQVQMAGLNFKVIATPGHTPGGCCYYFEEEGVLFCGDSLFAGSIGRTDFPGGSMKELIDSIRNKILTLPEEVRIAPGHMDLSTVGHEKTTNPFIV